MLSQSPGPALALGRPPPQDYGPRYLFQAELELSCRACRVAWNRGRSLSTGELMKRGRGLRKEPILWNSVGRLGAKPRVISPGEGTASCLHQKVPTAHRKELLPGLPSGPRAFLKPQSQPTPEKRWQLLLKTPGLSRIFLRGGWLGFSRRTVLKTTPVS